MPGVHYVVREMKSAVNPPNDETPETEWLVKTYAYESPANATPAWPRLREFMGFQRVNEEISYPEADRTPARIVRDYHTDESRTGKMFKEEIFELPSNTLKRRVEYTYNEDPRQRRTAGS
jgi:hypothetical protein